MESPEDRLTEFWPFVAAARWELREVVAGLLASRLDGDAAGAAHPPFLDAAARSVEPDPARPCELLVYARPAGAVKAQYRLRAVLPAELAPEDVVGRAYEAILGRPADAAGASGYVEAVSTGRLPRHRLLAALSASGEGRARGLDIVVVPSAAGRDA